MHAGIKYWRHRGIKRGKNHYEQIAADFVTPVLVLFFITNTLDSTVYGHCCMKKYNLIFSSSGTCCILELHSDPRHSLEAVNCCLASRDGMFPSRGKTHQSRQSGGSNGEEPCKSSPLKLVLLT